MQSDESMDRIHEPKFQSPAIHPVIERLIEALEAEAEKAISKVPASYRPRLQSITESCDAYCASQLQPLDREYAA